MERELKIKEHFRTLREDVAETLPGLDSRLVSQLTAFENVTAPARDIHPNDERYWIAKTAVIVEYLEDSFPDKKGIGRGYMVSCGYDPLEIERVDWFMNRKSRNRS